MAGLRKGGATDESSARYIDPKYRVRTSISTEAAKWGKTILDETTQWMSRENGCRRLSEISASKGPMSSGCEPTQKCLGEKRVLRSEHAEAYVGKKRPKSAGEDLRTQEGGQEKQQPTSDNVTSDHHDNTRIEYKHWYALLLRYFSVLRVTQCN
mmetsp:Transcript_11811/g.30145  ORF Transcript_11811/g.30145 Transcript_11811/m.30145 type:complete len:154 (+) Transcript_11811:189-650(+)